MDTALPLSAARTNSTDVVRLDGEDLFIVARYLVPTDAYVMQGCLVAGGVPAVVADANHVQADLLIAPAAGGVRILAPAAYLAQAQDILAAFERGEYALPDDFDPTADPAPGAAAPHE